MATLRGPSTTGAGLAAFLDAYQRERQLGQQEQALARQNQLAALQASEIIRKRTEDENRTKAIAAMSMAPLASFQPPVVAPVFAPTGAEAVELPESATPPPPPPVTALTPQAVAQHLGPEQAARVFGSEQGLRAFKALDGVTAEQFEQKKRLSDYRAKIKEFSKQALAAQAAGDPVTDLDFQRAGQAAGLEFLDPQHHANILKNMTTLSETRRKIVESEEEKKTAKIDGPKIAEGRRLMIEGWMESDGDKFGRGYAMASGAQTTYGRLKLGQLHAPDGLVTALLTKGDRFNSAGGNIEKRTAVLLQPRLTAPEGISDQDRIAALRQDYAQHPDEWGRMAMGLLAAGKQLPRQYQLAMTGTYLPDNDTKLAMHMALEEPRNPKAILTALKAVADAKKPERSLGDLQDRVDRRLLLREVNDAIQQISKDINALSAYGAAALNKSKIEKLETQLDVLVKQRDAIAAAMGAGNFPESPKPAEPGEGAIPKVGATTGRPATNAAPAATRAPASAMAPKGRAATRQEYDAAKQAAGRDLNRFREILRARGIDPALPPGP